MTNGWLSTQNPTQARKPASKIWLIVSQSCDPLSGRRWSSVRFVRFIFHPCVRRDPVHFPSLASIIRERLFKMARIRSDVRNNNSNKDGSAIQCFRFEKLDTSMPEVAHPGLAQGTTVPAGKITAPLV